MNKFYISAEQAHSMVSALAHCMSKEETRYYLNGLCVENTERGGLMAIATDGHRLGSMKLNPLLIDAVTSDLLIKQFSFIMSREAVEWIGKLPHKFTTPHLLTFEVSDSRVKLSLLPTMISAEFALVDGTFPDWRRVMPSEHTPSISFNADYVKHLAQAIKKAGTQNNPCITFSIENIGAPAVISTNQEGLQYVLMPMREYAEMRHTNAHIPAMLPSENPMAMSA